MSVYRIKKDLSACVVGKCSGSSGKCSICATPGVPNVALNCDLLVKSGLFNGMNFAHGRINDCFLIEDDSVPRVGIVEFKGKRYDESRALEQLESGMQIAKKLISRYGLKNSEVYLIIVARRHHPSSKKILLRKFRHSGFGESKVLMAGCNDTFRNVRERLRNL